MTRLYDRIVRNHIRPGSKYYRDWQGAVVIVADNVSEYYFAVSSKDDWRHDADFPNVAPPFEKTFIEFVAPTKVVSERSGIHTWEGFSSWGVLLTSKPFNDGWDVRGWLVAISDDDDQLLTPFRFAFVVAADGSFVKMPPGTIPDITEEMPALFIDSTTVPDGVDPLESAAENHMYLYPAFLTLSFMHCKNVVQRVISPPDTRKAKAKKRGVLPLVRYRVLDIEPMKTILRTEGQSENVGLQRALHICRGHFKTYDEKPLFGKVRGTFWWPSTVRGSLDEGAVVKDYRVHPPKQEGRGSDS